MRICVIFCLLVFALITGSSSTQANGQGDKEPDARFRERHRKHWQQEAYRLVPEFIERVDAQARTFGRGPTWHWFALEEHITEGFADTLVLPFLDAIKRDPTASDTAQRALVEIGRASVPALVTAVQDEKDGVREIAVAILTRIGPPAEAAVPTLEPIFLNDGDPLQCGAFGALRSIGDASSPVFIKALRCKECGMRVSAATALGDTPVGPLARRAVPELMRVLRDESEGLAGLGGFARCHFRSHVCETLASIGEASVPAVIESLGDKRPYVRGQCVHILGGIHYTREEVKTRAISSLIGALDDPDGNVRRYAAWSIAKFGPEAKEAVPGLIDQLGDEYGHACMAAAKALGEIGAEARPAIPVLKRLRREGSELVSMRSAEALERIRASTEKNISTQRSTEPAK